MTELRHLCDKLLSFELGTSKIREKFLHIVDLIFQNFDIMRKGQGSSVKS